MVNNHVLGFLTDEVCNRNDCKGIIEEHEKEGCCSCHTAPPCSYCVDDNHFCPECDWSGLEEQKKATDYSYSNFLDYHRRENAHEARIQEIKDKMSGKLPITCIEYNIFGHTHFSQICEGVHPLGTTREEVLKRVQGSFGGRFEYFRDTTFKYIAYTD